MSPILQAILALQPESQFAAAYEKGVHKSKYWESTYEDSMNLIAKLPQIAAMIYRHAYKGGKFIQPDAKLDWAANLAHMMGYEDEGAKELMRLYQTIHSDHEVRAGQRRMRGPSFKKHSSRALNTCAGNLYTDTPLCRATDHISTAACG